MYNISVLLITGVLGMLYTTRHREDWSIQKKAVGKCIKHLNETNLKQEDNKKNILDIDLIIYSLLKRTKQATQVINRKHFNNL